MNVCIKLYISLLTNQGDTNMSKIKLTVDSTCDLPASLAQKYGVEIIPLYTVLGETALRDGVEVTPDDIYKYVWNEESAIGDKSIAVHIRHIREKIEINPKEPRYLKNVWGIGYKVD